MRTLLSQLDVARRLPALDHDSDEILSSAGLLNSTSLETFAAAAFGAEVA